MNWFHRHRFVETERFYAASVSAESLAIIMRCLEGTTNAKVNVPNALVVGVTTVIERCACSVVRTTEVLGKSNRPTAPEFLRRPEWTEEEMAILKARGQSSLVRNVIQDILEGAAKAKVQA